MKKIDLGGNGRDFNRLQFSHTLSHAPRSRPFSTKEIFLALAILAKFTEERDVVLVEDAEYNFIMDVINATEWLSATPDIAAFVRCLQGAETIKVAEV